MHGKNSDKLLLHLGLPIHSKAQHKMDGVAILVEEAHEVEISQPEFVYSGTILAPVIYVIAVAVVNCNGGCLGGEPTNVGQCLVKGGIVTLYRYGSGRGGGYQYCKQDQEEHNGAAWHNYSNRNDRQVRSKK